MPTLLRDRKGLAFARERGRLGTSRSSSRAGLRPLKAGERRRRKNQVLLLPAQPHLSAIDLWHRAGIESVALKVYLIAFIKGLLPGKGARGPTKCLRLHIPCAPLCFAELLLILPERRSLEGTRIQILSSLTQSKLLWHISNATFTSNMCPAKPTQPICLRATLTAGHSRTRRSWRTSN